MLNIHPHSLKPILYYLISTVRDLWMDLQWSNQTNAEVTRNVPLSSGLQKHALCGSVNLLVEALVVATCSKWQ